MKNSTVKALEGKVVLIADIDELVRNYHQKMCFELGARHVILVDDWETLPKMLYFDPQPDLVILDRCLPENPASAGRVKEIIKICNEKRSQMRQLVAKISDAPSTEGRRGLIAQYDALEAEGATESAAMNRLMLTKSLVALFKELFLMQPPVNVVPWVFLEESTSDFEEAANFARHLFGTYFVRVWSKQLHERRDPAKEFKLLLEADDSELNRQYYRPDFIKFVTEVMC